MINKLILSFKLFNKQKYYYKRYTIYKSKKFYNTFIIKIELIT